MKDYISDDLSEDAFNGHTQKREWRSVTFKWDSAERL